MEFTPLARRLQPHPALTTGKVDVLFATMAMTEERAKAIQYSKPYAGNVISLYGPKDKTIAKAEDATGISIACRAPARRTRPPPT